MKKITLFCLAFSGALLLFGLPASAQDVHYTQFYNAPSSISPGLIGVFKEDFRAYANYRRQWFSVKSVNYETYTATADLKLWPYRPTSNGFFSLGLTLNHDQAGLSKLTHMNLGLNGSYTHRLSSFAFLSVGLQGVFTQKNFDITHLSFNEQYTTEGGYDPDLSNGEADFNRRSSFLSLGTGINLRIQALNEQELVDDLRHRSKLDIGFGISQLNRPDQSFEGDMPVRLPPRFTPYALSVVQLGKGNSKFDLALNAMLQFQQKYSEMIGMAGIRYHLTQLPGDHKAIQLGAAIRLADNEPNNVDGFAPVLEFFLNSWQFGISYDVTVSGYRVANNGNGGPEFSVRYGISKVKLPHPRLCQIL